MEVILITGLDGSGKSSVFNSLLNAQNNSYSLIMAPLINLDGLKADKDLYAAASFINTIGEGIKYADPLMVKSISLFSSMLLFRNILVLKKRQKVYCERHPLIDTLVYSHFYAGQLKPENRDLRTLGYLDSQFSFELNYITSQLPNGYLNSSMGKAESIINLIYEWLHVKQPMSPADLAPLFLIDLPDKVYYLKALPEVLFNRIKGREKLELHESLEVLKRLYSVYDSILKKLSVPVTEIDTTEPGASSDFFQSLLNV